MRGGKNVNAFAFSHKKSLHYREKFCVEKQTGKHKVSWGKLQNN